MYKYLGLNTSISVDLTRKQDAKVKAHPPIKDVYPHFVQESYADFPQNVFCSFLVILARPPLGTIPSLETPQASPRDIHHILINNFGKILEFLELPLTVDRILIASFQAFSLLCTA